MCICILLWISQFINMYFIRKAHIVVNAVAETMDTNGRGDRRPCCQTTHGHNIKLLYHILTYLYHLYNGIYIEIYKIFSYVYWGSCIYQSGNIVTLFKLFSSTPIQLRLCRLKQRPTSCVLYDTIKLYINFLHVTMIIYLFTIYI